MYEAADYRFFYTAFMIRYVTAVWNYAADLQWGNGICVEESRSPLSSISWQGNALTSESAARSWNAGWLGAAVAAAAAVFVV